MRRAMSRVLLSSSLMMMHYCGVEIESGPGPPGRPAFQCRGDWRDLTGTMMTSLVPMTVCADLKSVTLKDISIVLFRQQLA